VNSDRPSPRSMSVAQWRVLHLAQLGGEDNREVVILLREEGSVAEEELPAHPHSQISGGRRQNRGSTHQSIQPHALHSSHCTRTCTSTRL
jgi:hypothetical protein